MRRFWVLLVMLLLLNATASATGLAGLISKTGQLPDPADMVGVKPVLYEQDVRMRGAVYTAYTFPMPEDFDRFLSDYSIKAEKQGYTVSEDTVSAQPAIRIGTDARDAFLIPDYRGSMLFLVHTGIDYAPLPTMTPSPVPTATNTPTPVKNNTPVPSGGGHWERVEVQVDCEACTRGTCDLCKGTGSYSRFGVTIPCERDCQSCNGTGYWTVHDMVWVQ